jgi:hypothetical protein
MKIPKSIGYYLDEVKLTLGLVYDLPPGVNDVVAPATLLSLLENRSLPRHQLAALEEKFALARSQAGTLLSLHTVGWLHKNLGSHSVMCFAGASGSRLDYDNALVGGFGISRPDEPTAVSLDVDMPDDSLNLYVHPDLRTSASNRPKFHRRHDIYSLGVALFEIGIWDRVTRYGVRNNVPVQPYDFQARLVKYAEIELSPRMGRRYAEVVKRCLTGECFGRDLSDSLDIFCWMVVAELEKCHCQ